MASNILRISLWCRLFRAPFVSAILRAWWSRSSSVLYECFFFFLVFLHLSQENDPCNIETCSAKKDTPLSFLWS